jgi:hypothetical protein
MHGNGIETAMQPLGDITSRKALPNKRKYLLLARRKRLVDHLWIRKAPHTSIDRCRFADQRPSAQAERVAKAANPAIKTADYRVYSGSVSGVPLILFGRFLWQAHISYCGP